MTHVTSERTDINATPSRAPNTNKNTYFHDREEFSSHVAFSVCARKVAVIREVFAIMNSLAPASIEKSHWPLRSQ